MENKLITTIDFKENPRKATVEIDDDYIVIGGVKFKHYHNCNQNL